MYTYKTVPTEELTEDDFDWWWKCRVIRRKLFCIMPSALYTTGLQIILTRWEKKINNTPERIFLKGSKTHECDMVPAKPLPYYGMTGTTPILPNG